MIHESRLEHQKYKLLMNISKCTIYICIYIHIKLFIGYVLQVHVKRGEWDVDVVENY